VTLDQQNVAAVAQTCIRAGQSNNTAAHDDRLEVHCQSTVPVSDFSL
jgi:ribosomal protein S27AE